MHKNLMGDIVAIQNSAGKSVVQYTYDPFGKCLSVSGTMAATVGSINPLRYRGYYYDNETGYYYLATRYYNPDACRFLNADSLVCSGPGILGYNMYIYCQNNPVMFSDPSGMGGFSGGFVNRVMDRVLPDSTISGTVVNGVAHDAPSGGGGSGGGGGSNPPVQQTPTPESGGGNPFFNEKDGSYGLYDSDRKANPDPVFREKILSGKFSGPSWSVDDGSFGLGSADITAITGGWRWDGGSLDLLDFGKAELAAQYKDGALELGAMASAWSPSISFNIGDCKVTLSLHVGSIGFSTGIGKKGLHAGVSYVVGGSISIS